MNAKKILLKALAAPGNLRFAEVCVLAEGFGFKLSRISGSHHIFIHSEVRELVNLQEDKGKAIAYQVRQLLKLAEKYNLMLGGES